MKLIQISACFAFSTIVAFGCAATDAIDNKIDCSGICNRYKDCFDSKYDVDTCKSRCESSAKNDDKFEAKVDVCSACIDDKSCTSATFKCGSECSAIVP